MFGITALMTVAAIGAGVAAEGGEDDYVVVTYYGYTYQGRFESTIMTKALARTPIWKESSPNPPLCAQAMKLADAKRSKLVHDTQAGHWEREAAELREARDEHRWYWLVRYEFSETGTGPVPELILFVLMDGTVVEPKLRRDQDMMVSPQIDHVNRSGRFVGPSSTVELSGDDITDETMSRLKDWPQLSFLTLNKCAVTDKGLKHLKGMTKLEWLDIAKCKITDEGLEGLDGLAKLKHLGIYGAKVTDKGLVHLKGLANLEDLDIQDCGLITDASLAHLKGLTRLRTVCLANTQITGAGLDYLKELRDLTSVDMVDANITDETMVHLRGLQQVVALNLSGNPITDKGLDYFRGPGLFKQLRSLRLYDTGVTDHAVERLRVVLPKCGIQK